MRAFRLTGGRQVTANLDAALLDRYWKKKSRMDAGFNQFWYVRCARAPLFLQTERLIAQALPFAIRSRMIFR